MYKSLVQHRQLRTGIVFRSALNQTTLPAGSSIPLQIYSATKNHADFRNRPWVSAHMLYGSLPTRYRFLFFSARVIVFVIF